MSLRAPQATDEDPEPQPVLRIHGAIWDGASLNLKLRPQLDGELEVTVGGHGPWTVTAETGTATLSPDLPTKERLEDGSWVRVRLHATAPWSAPACPVRPHHLDHQLVASPGRQAALRRVITGNPEVSDDIASLLAELERTLVLTPRAIRQLATPSKTTKVNTSGHESFDDLETLWASLSAHPNVEQYSELDLQIGLHGPPSDLAVLLAALGARLPQPLRDATQRVTVDVDDGGDHSDPVDELMDDEHESEEERAIRLADEAAEHEKQRANAQRHYRRFLERACTAYECAAFRALLTPQMVATQAIVLTNLTSQLIIEDLATADDATEWLVRLWRTVFNGTGGGSEQAPDATELREHLTARGWTASFVVALTRVAGAAALSPAAASLAPLRAAAHHVVAHDSCPPLSAEALDTLATEVDATTVDGAWSLIEDILSGLSQDEVRRDLEHVAGLGDHSTAFRRVTVRRGRLGEQHVEQLELPGSPETADDDLVKRLVGRWKVLEPARDYYRVFVPVTENTNKVVAVYDRATGDAWVLSNGEVVDIVELPDQRPAWRYWLDEMQPPGS